MRIELKTDSKEITLGIINASRSHLNAAFHNAANEIKRDIIAMAESLLIQSPEYSSLLNGVLKAELGLEDSEARLRQIVETIKSSVGVSVIPVSNFSNQLRGGIVVTMIRKGFEDILGLAAASYQSKEFLVPWLNWLLLQGDKIIVAGYHIKYTPSSADGRNSRSGVAVMEKGGGWRVPPMFSGVEEDNWITRTFDVNKIEGLINDIVQKRLSRRL